MENNTPMTPQPENQLETQPEEQISDETLEQVSGGKTVAVDATENSTVADIPDEGAGAKGHFFKFKKKKFFHHHLHHD
ncbi:MAG: hypothetical protein AAFQ63_15095 [Cyanobacteria bacterium J06621_11]